MQTASGKSWLTRGVLTIGLASLFSDIGHEMVTVILPAFLVGIGGSATALGVIEGSADFFSSVAKLYAGYVGGRMRHKKWAAGAGYVITALATGSIALATTWPHVLMARIVAWLGRGFRSPLRDTLMVEQTSQEHFGKAFGLERAMDSIGAVAGPFFCLVLFVFGLAPKMIIALTFIPGLVAGILMVWGIRDSRTAASDQPRASTHLPHMFRRFIVAVALFGLGDFSRTLLILWATGEELRFLNASSMTLPIVLYVMYNLVGSLSSYVSGHWSDVIGRKGLLVGGYAIASLVSIVMMFNLRAVPIMIVVFVGSGVYMGIQEAIERAMAADLLPQSSRSFGFGVLASINGVADFVSSLAVGALWDLRGPTSAFAYSAVFTAVGALALAALIPAETMTKTDLR